MTKAQIKRNADIFNLRNKNPKHWTYKKLGEKFGRSPSRMMAIFQKEKYKRNEDAKKYYSSILGKMEEYLQVLNKELALSLLTSSKRKIRTLQERKNKIIIEGREVLYKIEKSSMHKSLKDQLEIEYEEFFSEENTITF